MRINGKNQSNKFIRIITIPLRALTKARDLYVKSMTSYANKVSSSHSMAMPGDGHFPRSFSASSARSSHINDSDDFRELIRAASASSYGHKNEVDMYLQQLIKQQQLKKEQQKGVFKESLPKAKSGRAVGMGRIEECDEEGSLRGRLFGESS